MATVHAAALRDHAGFGYNPALDGLRALAIAAVVAQHAGIPGVKGYHGVTLFFVISGYLITRLLLQEHYRTGRLRLGAFYRRRFARLAPALIVAVLVTWLWLLLTAKPLASYWAGIVGSLSYTTALIQAIFGNGAVSNYYQWSWSLGVEELFYLIWPVTLLVMVRWRRFAWAVVALVTSIAGIWLLRIVLVVTGASHDRYFFSPDTNADALLLGTLLGVHGLPLAVMVVAASMPIGANVFMFAQRYRVAEELVTASVVVSTVLALATVSLALAGAARLAAG